MCTFGDRSELPPPLSHPHPALSLTPPTPSPARCVLSRARAIRLMVRLLPLSAVVRLAFGCWMIGSSAVLTDFTVEDYPLSPYVKVGVPLSRPLSIPI